MNVYRVIKKSLIPITWIQSHLTNKQLIVIYSILVGITAGLAAVMLKTAVHYVRLVLTLDFFSNKGFPLFVLLPTIGLIATLFFTRNYIHSRLEAGSAKIIFSILKRAGNIQRHQVYSHIVTSAITVGMGGSAGLEAPIVATGSAIGSNFGQSFNLGYKEKVLLLACGAAAGIAAVFNAPIAGVLFTLEVLLIDVTISAFIPLIIAAVAGELCANLILHEGILFTFKLRNPFSFSTVHYYIALGIISGLFSVYYTRIFQKTEAWFHRITGSYKKALLAGAILAVLIFLFPPLFGEGYESIKALSDIRPGDLFKSGPFSSFKGKEGIYLILIGAILLVKSFATSLTLSGGGNGGNFAPSLFVGAYLGFGFSYLLNMLNIATVPIGSFTLVGMAGALSGIYHAPLTAIFLIAEITGGYDLIIPLMIVAALSYSVVKYFEPHSMDFKKLVKKGHVLDNNKDQMILSSINTSDIIDKNMDPVLGSEKLRRLVEIISSTQQNIFPVINAEKHLIGIIPIDNIMNVMFKPELYDEILIRDIMLTPPAIIKEFEAMHLVMKKLDDTKAWYLPVVDSHRQYVGMISKSTILANYRDMLQTRNID